MSLVLCCEELEEREVERIFVVSVCVCVCVSLLLKESLRVMKHEFCKFQNELLVPINRISTFINAMLSLMKEFCG